MEGKYIVQMICVLLVVIPLFTLGIYSIFKGRFGRKYRGKTTITIPINLFTTILVLIMAFGGIMLVVTGFNACDFMAHWLPAEMMTKIKPFSNCP